MFALPLELDGRSLLPASTKKEDDGCSAIAALGILRIEDIEFELDIANLLIDLGLRVRHIGRIGRSVRFPLLSEVGRTCKQHDQCSQNPVHGQISFRSIPLTGYLLTEVP